jgi:hypothetical protein
MKKIKLNKLKSLQKDFLVFKLKEDSNKVYIINHYNHSDKTYSVSQYDDINKERFIKANKDVFIGFTF